MNKFTTETAPPPKKEPPEVIFLQCSKIYLTEITELRSNKTPF